MNFSFCLQLSVLETMLMVEMVWPTVREQDMDTDKSAAGDNHTVIEKYRVDKLKEWAFPIPVKR